MKDLNDFGFYDFYKFNDKSKVRVRAFFTWEEL